MVLKIMLHKTPKKFHMKKASPAFVLALAAQLLTTHHLSAQSIQNSLQGPPANINIDGDLKDWATAFVTIMKRRN